MQYDDSGAVPMRVSYRQAGKTVVGTVVRGPPPAITSVMAGQGEATAYPSMRPRAKRSQPSIPSKFETTLHVGQRERNAFGTRTLRFTPGEHELPGPGNYHRNSSMVRTGASVSKLGAGVGFVSKTKRFTDKAERIAAAMPAPGSYEAPSSVMGKKDFSRAPSANFAKPRKYRDSTAISFRPSPGPGEYESGRAFTAPASVVRRNTNARKIVGTSTFKSASKRDSYLSRDSGVPPPGAYEAPPMAAPVGGTIFKSIPDRLKHLYPAAYAEIPGPGEYEPPAKAIPGVVAVQDPARPSSMFSNTQHDRYGVPYVRKVTTDGMPGPGAYSKPVFSEVPRMSAASSMFLSSAKRDSALQRKGAKPPGPAFYKPQPPGKKSFLLNAAQRWV